jgi:hypothetical protein
MSDEDPLTLHQAEADVADPRLTPTRRQPFKLRVFLGFAKLLRWCRLI